MMKKIMHILFLSCLKATELIEKKLNFKLSYKEKIQLKIHKVMCDACNRYEKQSILIEKGIGSINVTNELEIDFEQLKNRIAHKLGLSDKNN